MINYFITGSEEKPTPKFVCDSPYVVISEPVIITPFKNPELYGEEYFKKEYSRDEVFCFVRYLKFHTDFLVGNSEHHSISYFFKEWKKRLEQKIWD